MFERKKLIDQFKASDNKTQFALDHHIPSSTLYRWSKQNDLIEAYDGTTINVKMYLEALRSNEKMQQIIEILQRSHCTVSSSLAEKMAEMEIDDGLCVTTDSGCAEQELKYGSVRVVFE